MIVIAAIPSPDQVAYVIPTGMNPTTCDIKLYEKHIVIKQIIDGNHLVKPTVSLTKLVPVISRTIAKPRNI